MKCVAQGGRQCLLRQEWTYAACCNPDTSSASTSCKYDTDAVYCSDKASVTNAVMHKFTCPSRRAKCPASQEEVEVLIEKEDEVVVRT